MCYDCVVGVIDERLFDVWNWIELIANDPKEGDKERADREETKEHIDIVNDYSGERQRKDGDFFFDEMII